MLKRFYFCIFALISVAATAPTLAPPSTAKKPVEDEYYGIKVIDSYRWLDPLEDPEVQKWNHEQNEYTRSLLDSYPAREHIAKRLNELYSDKAVDYYGLQFRRGVLFALKSQPPKQQPFLIKLASPFDLKTERTVLDPNVLDPSGATAID